MITVSEAEKIIQAEVGTFGVETISFDQSLGRILAEDIQTDTDLPPFHRVMMDGIAIQFSDFESGIQHFQIQDMQRAGDYERTLRGSGFAIEIMTGSILPNGTDVIIPYEQLEIENGWAKILHKEVKKGQHIHRQGSDRKQWDVLIPAHTRIGASAIGIMASVGKTNVDVFRNPRIHVFSSGDELVPPDSVPLPHQIRRSNVFALQQLLLEYGLTSTQSHLADDPTAIYSGIKHALEDCDVILLTGGVSKGKYDLIPEILDKLGVQKLFHRVAQRPGKPFWFGRNKKTVVFAFPGNPVSTLACASRYLIPYLQACKGVTHLSNIHVSLASDYMPHSQLTLFLPVKIVWNHTGICQAIPQPGNGSGDFSSLITADAFVELQAQIHPIRKGTVLPAYLLHAIK